MVNVLSLFDTILTCSKYISSNLWQFSGSFKSTTSTNSGACILAIGIGSTYTKDIYIGSIYAISTLIRYTSASWWIKNVEPKALAGLKLIFENPGVIFTDADIDHYCFWLSIVWFLLK